MREYDKTHKKDRKIRNRFFKKFSSPDGETNKYYASFRPFKNPATIHMYRHSTGECYGEHTVEKPNNYHLDEKTFTAHQIDRSVTDEFCLNCGNALIKLHNINRLQCIKCYSAKCFHCKAGVDPNIDQIYKHFWVPCFNSFIPNLCPYFQNSGKFNIVEKDTCDSCERADQGAKQSIRNHFSEQEQRYICNDKCPSEPFNTMCDALNHILQKHPIQLRHGETSKFFSSNILDNGHILMENYDEVFDKEKEEWVKELVVEGGKDVKSCFCSYTRRYTYGDENHKLSYFSHNKKYMEELKRKATYENGVYKCTFTCKDSFQYPCQMWWHLEYEDGDEKHWYSRSSDSLRPSHRNQFFCGLDSVNTENVPDIKFPYATAYKGNYFDTAKAWVKQKVKKNLYKICCCQEESGLFCRGEEHHDEISQRQQIYECNYFSSENSKSKLYMSPYIMSWKNCYKKM